MSRSSNIVEPRHKTINLDINMFNNNYENNKKIKLFIIFLFFMILAISLQVANKSYDSEFGGHPDEAAHFVTGLMVHDYLVGMKWRNPVKFAETYYLHYPKVALGHWPPFFYVVQALWMAMFGASRAAIMALLAALTATTGLLLALTVRRRYGWLLGVIVGMQYVVLPMVQEATATLMAEGLLTVLSLGATLSYSRYLDDRNPVRWSALFGVLALLAILTKANGLCLALVPVPTLMLTRRMQCMRQPSFWLPAVIVALGAGPFYWLTLPLQQNGSVSTSFSADYSLKALSLFGSGLVTSIGGALATLALIGFNRRIVRPLWRDQVVEPLWASLASLIFSVLVFHILVPASLELRFALLWLPAVMIFVADGLDSLRGFISDHLSKRKIVIIVTTIIMSVIGVWPVLRLCPKEWRGFGPIITEIESKPKWNEAVVMVASDPQGEGMMIAEWSLHDQRPGRYVLRASKVLGRDLWSGRNYRTAFESPRDVDKYLKEIPVRLLVIDTSLALGTKPRHHEQIDEMLRNCTYDWKLVGSSPIVRRGRTFPDALKVYELQNSRSGPPKIEVDLGAILGRTLSN